MTGLLMKRRDNVIREVYNAKSPGIYNSTKQYGQTVKNTAKVDAQDSFIKASEPSLVPDVYDNIKTMDSAKAEKIFSKANESSSPDYFGNLMLAATEHYVKSAKIFEEALKNDSNPDLTNKILDSKNSAFEKICAKYT